MKGYGVLGHRAKELDVFFGGHKIRDEHIITFEKNCSYNFTFPMNQGFKYRQGKVVIDGYKTNKSLENTGFLSIHADGMIYCSPLTDIDIMIAENQIALYGYMHGESFSLFLAKEII